MPAETKKNSDKDQFAAILKFFKDFQDGSITISISPADEKETPAIMAELKLMESRFKDFYQTMSQSLECLWQVSDDLFQVGRRLEVKGGEIFQKAETILEEKEMQVARFKKVKAIIQRNKSLKEHLPKVNEVEEELRQMHLTLTEIITSLKYHTEALAKVNQSVEALDKTERSLRELGDKFHLHLERSEPRAKSEDEDEEDVSNRELLDVLFSEYGLE